LPAAFWRDWGLFGRPARHPDAAAGNKEIARGVYQPFILVGHIATLILIGVTAVERTGFALLLAALPPLIVGVFIGWRIYGHLDEKRFRQVLAAALIASGVTLII
jgi:uncharacterized membrane protein YfcA